MSISLYSAGTIDSLLAGKLTISSLSNAATSTLDATVPTAGQALTFDGTNLVWATVGGGGGASWGSISGTLSSQSDLWTALSALAPTASPSFSGTVSITGSWGSITFGDGTTGSLVVYNGSQTTSYGANGITFPDSTVQTTAATAGASRADVITISHVQNVTNVYFGGVQFTFAPINYQVAAAANLYVTDGTTTEYITGGWSETLPWTFTSSSALSTSTYLYVGAWGQTSTIPVTFP